MRYLTAAIHHGKNLSSEHPTNMDVARRAVAEPKTEPLIGALVLVGGRKPAELIVRQAQSHLRIDQLASYWSHAAILVHVSTDLVDAEGVEVALDPTADEPQVPERNGVTRFRLDQFLDDDRCPNFALATLRLGPGADSAAAHRLATAADEPLRERSRFPFLDWLAAWRAHTTAPYRFPNPSLQDVPHPGAALCEYVLEAARIDITPGGEGQNSCPETIWATLVRWRERLANTGVLLDAHYVLRDPTCESRKPLPSRLGLPLPPAPAPTDAPKRKRTEARPDGRRAPGSRRRKA
jgi:hypothetical protein